jgi:hypothetical protein
MERNMKAWGILAGVVLLAGLGSIDRLLGCGDKFLVSSRGTRYQRAPVAYGPAAILIYTNPASEVPRALASVSVAGTLSRAGYRPTLAGNAAEFEAMLSRGGWDLVLVGMADAQAVSQRVKSSAGVLPVVLTAADLKQTRKQYPVVLKGPTKSEAFLETIADALASRPRTKGKTGA